MYNLMKYQYRAFSSKGKFEESVKTVIVGPRGRNKIPVLMLGSAGLTVKKVPITEERYMREADTGRKTMKGIVRQYRGIGNRLGATKAAKSFLTSAYKAA